MNLVSTVTTKGQVVIPKPIRDKFQIKPSDRVFFEVYKKRIIMEPAPTVDEMFGFIKTKNKITEREIDRAVAEGIAEEYEKKLRSGRI